MVLHAVTGLELAVFRDTSGQAHVVDAYCPHMGASLGVGGQVRGDCIECPFHGWKFRGYDGKCVHVPYAENKHSKYTCTASVYTSWHVCSETGVTGRTPQTNMGLTTLNVTGVTYHIALNVNCAAVHQQTLMLR